MGQRRPRRLAATLAGGLEEVAGVDAAQLCQLVGIQEVGLQAEAVQPLGVGTGGVGVGALERALGPLLHAGNGIARGAQDGANGPEGARQRNGDGAADDTDRGADNVAVAGAVGDGLADVLGVLGPLAAHGLGAVPVLRGVVVGAAQGGVGHGALEEGGQRAQEGVPGLGGDAAGHERGRVGGQEGRLRAGLDLRDGDGAVRVGGGRAGRVGGHRRPGWPLEGLLR